jgi:hypothetical protein
MAWRDHAVLQNSLLWSRQPGAQTALIYLRRNRRTVDGATYEYWTLERITCLLAIVRFCAQPCELGEAERWYQRTALEDLLGKINDDQI